MTAFTIRPFTDADFELYCAVWNAVWPEYPETPDELRHRDATRDPKLVHGRVIAQEPNGDFVGGGYFNQHAGMYHPQRFHLEVMTAPHHEGKGVGSALYEAILTAIATHNPLWLRAEVREDIPRALRFVQSRGFTEDQREQESKLNLSGFDPAAFSGHLARVRDWGIDLVSFSERKARDPAFFDRLYDLSWELKQDVPSPDGHTRAEYEVWRRRFDDPHFLWDGSFLALDGPRYVGMSTLRASPSNDDLDTGLTGVSRDYRKRGIASALKVRALTYAKEHGSGSVRTWNEVGNTGMLGINFRLGFVRQPVWISFVKTLKLSEGNTV